MGAEVECRATIEGVERLGRAQLESEYLLFRSEGYRVKLPLAGVAAQAVDGRLELGRVTLHLGAHAAKWADKISNPKSLLEKLGVKPGLSVVVIGVKDPDFLAQLTAPAKRLKPNLDLVFLGAELPPDLDRLPDVRQSLAPAGAVWVVYPKGTKAITQEDVMRATKAAGLVDVKVAAFSKTHTALKAVIPVSQR